MIPVKSLLSSLVLAFTIAPVGLQAASFVDFDKIVTELKTSGSNTYSSWFNLVTEDSGADVYSGSGAHGPTVGVGGSLLGYQPGSLIKDATVSFHFYANDSAKEKMEIKIGGLFLSNFPGDKQINGYETFTLALTPTMITDLQVDGKISYSVKILDLTNNTDNVWLKWGRLDVTTREVPDTGSTALLGGAVFALLALGRRRLQR